MLLQAVNMLALSAGLYICRQIPFFGKFVAPVVRDFSANEP